MMRMSALRRDDSFVRLCRNACRACARRALALRRIYEREEPVLQVRHTALPKNVTTQQALDARLMELLRLICAMQQAIVALAANRWMVNSLIARKFPPASRDNEQGPLDRTMPSGLVAVSGLDHGLAMDPTLPTFDPPPLVSAVEMNCGSAMPASARDAQRQWPGTNADQRSESKTLTNDPSLVAPVIASPKELFRARELREQIRKEYLSRPSQPRSLWCVGID